MRELNGVRDRKVTLRARRLRTESTVAERELWALLRNSQLNGWKFRRQSGVADYVVDFLCAELKLVVEIDGPAHEEPEQAAFDERRDAAIKMQGFHILRLNEKFVRQEPSAAVLLIISVGKRIEAGLPAIPETDDT